MSLFDNDQTRSMPWLLKGILFGSFEGPFKGLLKGSIKMVSFTSFKSSFEEALMDRFGGLEGFL